MASSSLGGPGQTPASQRVDVQKYTLRNHKCPIFHYTTESLADMSPSHQDVAVEDTHLKSTYLLKLLPFSHPGTSFLLSSDVGRVIGSHDIRKYFSLRFHFYCRHDFYAANCCAGILVSFESSSDRQIIAYWMSPYASTWCCFDGGISWCRRRQCGH